MKRLLLVLAALWVGRWLALEGASQLARRLPRGPAPIESERKPGWMPGPTPSE